MPEYIYDANWESERERLSALEMTLDPGTVRVLESLQIGPTWRCLEVGGGGGSITRWLCERAGAVVVTDIDTRFVEQIDAANLEVRTHDIVNDALEEGAFDLVHSRDLLEHLPERERALDKMVAALKPGGWIVVEDVDFTPELFGSERGFGGKGVERSLVAKTFSTATSALRSAGVDGTFGRELPARLEERGLEEVGADVRAQLVRGGSQAARLTELSISHLKPLLIRSGALTDAQVNTLLASFRDPGAFWFAPIHVAAWGRKPA